MSELPKGWVRGSLGDILRIRNGYAFKSTEFKLDGVPLVRQSNLDGDKVDLTKCVYLDEQYLLDRAGFTLCKGDVLIGMSGSVGKLCTYDQDFVALQNQRVGKIELHASSQTEWRFVWHYRKTVTGALLEKAKGVAVANVSPDDIHSLALNIPPLAEQTRIAAKLDELLPQVDTLKARIDGIPALLKRFLQSVLAAAVSGRLTEEWRASNSVSESAEEYLARVIQCRRQNPIVKFKEPVSPDLEKRDIEVPQGWVVASVSSFAECLDSMRVPVKKELRKSGEGKYPYFGANGEVDRVDEYIFDDDLVLVTEDETFYGREKPIAYKYSGKCWVNNHVHALRAHDSVARDYLCCALMHYDVIPWLTGTTGRAKLTQGALLSLPIQVPPAAEQTEIVRRIEQLFVFADQLEARVKAAQARIDRLTQSILAKAFRGELVPQDPNDEPASVLLARIQAQRASAPKAKRKRRVGAD